MSEVGSAEWLIASTRKKQESEVTEVGMGERKRTETEPKAAPVPVENVCGDETVVGGLAKRCAVFFLLRYSAYSLPAITTTNSPLMTGRFFHS